MIGRLRYFFEMIRPELQQYFVESERDGKPIPREFRSLIYQRAKREKDAVPYGTRKDFNEPGTEWTEHSFYPKKVSLEACEVKIGNEQCSQSYKASLLNISGLSYGSLSKNAIEALNEAAKKGGFFHNTGEGGISPYHKKGGDLCWQIGTGYFGCRTSKGEFCPQTFKKNSRIHSVKMIEIKLSQGAKPGRGGLLPGSKVSPEIAKIRGVPLGKDVVSPSTHSAFSDPSGLLDFVERLRGLSGGKPVGIKMCIGRKKDFIDFCEAMESRKIFPDFLTIDGSEGGTGAAPLEFTNAMGMPLNEALAFVDKTLKEKNLREHMKLIASGKVFTAFHMVCKIALGADLINSGRGMMLALGCIHALTCHTNTCPVGVATTDERLVRGLHIPRKAERVFHYHQNTMKTFCSFLGAMGYETPQEIKRSDIFKRTYEGDIKTYEELYESS